MFENITDYFMHLIDQAGSYDIALAEFKHHLDDDAELQSQYSSWCDENGYSERNGFADFCQEHFDSNNEVWDSLNDYDE